MWYVVKPGQEAPVLLHEGSGEEKRVASLVGAPKSVVHGLVHSGIMSPGSTYSHVVREYSIVCIILMSVDNRSSAVRANHAYVIFLANLNHPQSEYLRRLGPKERTNNVAFSSITTLYVKVRLSVIYYLLHTLLLSLDEQFSAGCISLYLLVFTCIS